MNRIKSLILLIGSSLMLTACGLWGIHFNVHNPRKDVKYPKFDKETVLLGELTSIRENFDVHFYDLDITLDPATKTLGGWVEIAAIALKDIDSIQLDMDQPLHLDGLYWQDRKGKTLSYKRVERAIYIQLPDRISAGSEFSIYVQYNGKPVEAKKPPWRGGVVWEKDDFKKPWAGVACESDGASLWFPCKDHTSDEPDSAKMHFSISDTSLFIVSNGQFLGSEMRGDLKTFNWKITYPINLYNITFYLGDFVKIEDTYKGINSKTLEITHYVLRLNENIARNHFKQLKEQIRFFEELYGEYPWYRDGFKLVESPYAGMEHQTAIAYGSGYENDIQGKVDYIILHETGHEWFGNAVSVSDLDDVWIQEGVTTYAESLFLEQKYGDNAAYQHLLLQRWMIKNKKPLVGMPDRRYFDHRDGDAYVKAAWMLHTLRHNINNDKVFFKILKEFYTKTAMQLTNSKEFINTVNSVTGKNYNWFFDQYLYNNKVPFFEYDYVAGEALYYRWNYVKSDFNKITIPIRFSDADPFISLTPSPEIQKLEIELSNAPNLYIDNSKALFGKSKNKKLSEMYKKQQEGS